MLMYLVLGCLMDALAMIILTVPIIFPVIKQLGFDPIWFGVIIVMTVELGLIHPPVGMNIFVIKSVIEDVKIIDHLLWRPALHHHRYPAPGPADRRAGPSPCGYQGKCEGGRWLIFHCGAGEPLGLLLRPLCAGDGHPRSRHQKAIPARRQKTRDGGG